MSSVNNICIRIIRKNYNDKNDNDKTRLFEVAREGLACALYNPVNDIKHRDIISASLAPEIYLFKRDSAVSFRLIFHPGVYAAIVIRP